MKQQFRHVPIVVFAILLVAALGVVTATTHADAPVDHNKDGRIDVATGVPAVDTASTRTSASISIGMLETGDYAAPYARLQSLCLEPTLVSPDADLDTLRQYDLLYLPVQWAQKDVGDYATVDARADAYRTYVHDGGMLFVDQPNPYQQAGERITPDLLPYPVTFYNAMDAGDYPPTVVNSNHPVTRGVPAEDLPFPADQMLDVDARYEVLVQGASSGAPSLIVVTYGAGRVLIQTAHPGKSELIGHPIGSRAYMQMLAWLGAHACPVYLPVVAGK